MGSSDMAIQILALRLTILSGILAAEQATVCHHLSFLKNAKKKKEEVGK